MSKTRTHKLPSVPAQDPATRRFLDAAKEIIEVGEGQRGDPLDAKVTRRDLTDIGLAELRSRKGGGDGIGAVLRRTEDLPNKTEPPAPRQLKAEGATTSVVISWEPPRYANHAYTEVWRASSDRIEDAAQVGSQSAAVHVDDVGNNFDGHYWVRHVTTAGVRGRFAGPVSAETAKTPDSAREELTSQQWKPDTPWQAYHYVVAGELRARVLTPGVSGSTEPDWPSTPGETVEDGSVVWEVISPEEAVPFVVGTDEDGNEAVYLETAYIQDATIKAAKIERGMLDNLTAVHGKLSSALISVAEIWDLSIGDQIQSREYSPGERGWRISRDGNAEFSDGVFRGHVEAKSGTFKGNLESIGLFHNGAKTHDQFIDFRPNSRGEFVLGDKSRGSYLEFDGEKLRVRGQFQTQDVEAGTDVTLISANTTIYGLSVEGHYNSANAVQSGVAGSVRVIVHADGGDGGPNSHLWADWWIALRLYRNNYDHIKSEKIFLEPEDTFAGPYEDSYSYVVPPEVYFVASPVPVSMGDKIWVQADIYKTDGSPEQYNWDWNVNITLQASSLEDETARVSNPW